MIQVIGRAFGVLERLSGQGPSSVKDLAEATGLKKSTLCNILKTMVEMGYVVKSERGRYELGEKLAQMAAPQRQQEALVRLGREAVVRLADETGEAALIAVLREGERQILAEARSRQGLIVNSAVMGRSVFASATGWVLLAQLEEDELKQLVTSRNLASAGWEGSYRELKTMLAKVREEGMGVYRGGDGQAVGLGVPVLGKEGRVEAALGVYLPSVRFRGAHQKQVIGLLKSTAREMSSRMSAEAGQSN